MLAKCVLSENLPHLNVCLDIIVIEVVAAKAKATKCEHEHEYERFFVSESSLISSNCDYLTAKCVVRAREMEDSLGICHVLI